jgi:DNA polymerase
MRTLEEAALEASTCTRCRLAQGRTQVVYGVGNPNANLMFIGEGPGYYEDKQGEPFVGAAGQLLNRMLAEIEIPREDVYINNVVMCRPPGNRDPLPDEIEACTPWLTERIELIDPVVVVTLGNWATRFILDRQVSISRVRGQRFAWKGRIVIPTFHPAAILHGGGEDSSQMSALRDDFREIRRALDEPPEPPEAPAPAEPAAGASQAAEEPVEEQLGLF